MRIDRSACTLDGSIVFMKSTFCLMKQCSHPQVRPGKIDSWLLVWIVFVVFSDKERVQPVGYLMFDIFS